MKVLELIDAYYHDEISDEQLAELEHLLESDANARQLYRDYGGMVCGLETMKRLTEADDLEAPIEAPEPKPFMPRMRRFSIAAACILSALLSTGTYALFVQQQLAELPLDRIELFF